MVPVLEVVEGQAGEGEPFHSVGTACLCLLDRTGHRGQFPGLGHFPLHEDPIDLIEQAD